MSQNKELYDWYKKMGICPQCGSNKAAPGKVRCEECLAKNADGARKQREKMTQKQADTVRENHRTYLKNSEQTERQQGCVSIAENPRVSIRPQCVLSAG